jgi:hypothetical protein
MAVNVIVELETMTQASNTADVLDDKLFSNDAVVLQSFIKFVETMY